MTYKMAEFLKNNSDLELKVNSDKDNFEMCRYLGRDLHYVKDIIENVDLGKYKKDIIDLLYIYNINYEEDNNYIIMLSNYDFNMFLENKKLPTFTIFYTFDPLAILSSKEALPELLKTNTYRKYYNKYDINSFNEMYKDNSISEYDGTGELILRNKDGSFSKVEMKGKFKNIELSPFDYCDYFLNKDFKCDFNKENLFVDWANK